MDTQFQEICCGSARFLQAGRDTPAEATTADEWRALLGLDPVRAMAKVEGHFAAAVRDIRGRIVLAVDRFSTRPLFYRVQGDQLLVAGRADTIAASPDAPEVQALFDYLYFHVIPSPRTVFAGVFSVPPAHCAIFEAGRIEVRPYWVPRFQDRGSGQGFAALKAEFRQLLRDAVGRQLDGSPAAAYLSGGTDSSTVAGMIEQACGTKAATYSIGFDAAGYDEMAYARIAARHFGTRHHEYYVTPEDLVRSIPEVAAAYDQPFGNSSALPAYYCARMARADGVTRILAGDGGDELFGGNARYAKQRVFNAYGGLPPRLRCGLLEPLSELRAVRHAPLARKFSSYVDQARQPLPGRLESYNLLLRLGTTRVLTPGFLAQVDTTEPARAQEEVWQACTTDSLVNRHLAFDWRYTLADCDLPKVVGTSQLAGLQVGFPMLDTALVDFSLRLPDAYKVRGLKLRWFFKEALRGFLPDEIIRKKKQGFGLPFGVWMLQHQGLGDLARDSLGSLAGRGIVQPAFLRELLEQRLAEHPGYYGEMVWILVMLEQWLRHRAPDWRLP